MQRQEPQSRQPDYPVQIRRLPDVYKRQSLHYVFGINYDISRLTMIESALHDLVTPVNTEEKPKEITHNVNDLLDHLIEESVALVGKPVALMNKDDKVCLLYTSRCV